MQGFSSVKNNRWGCLSQNTKTYTHFQTCRHCIYSHGFSIEPTGSNQLVRCAGCDFLISLWFRIVTWDHFAEWMVSLRNVQHWPDIHMKVGEIKLRTHAQVHGAANSPTTEKTLTLPRKCWTKMTVSGKHIFELAMDLLHNFPHKTIVLCKKHNFECTSLWVAELNNTLTLWLDFLLTLSRQTHPPFVAKHSLISPIIGLSHQS